MNRAKEVRLSALKRSTGLCIEGGVMRRRVVGNAVRYAGDLVFVEFRGGDGACASPYFQETVV